MRILLLAHSPAFSPPPAPARSRFLQGPETDRAEVERLKTAIANCEGLLHGSDSLFWMAFSEGARDGIAAPSVPSSYPWPC